MKQKKAASRKKLKRLSPVDAWFANHPELAFFRTYWLVLLVILFIANYAVTRKLQLLFYAQSCMSREQVSKDSRCLYVWGQQVYEKGTRSKPHKGHACGMDVTSIMPSFHIKNMAKYMDPNLVGNVCSGTLATNTPVPTAVPTRTPTAVPTRTPTESPTAVPTRTPTQTPTRVPTAVPTVGGSGLTTQPTAAPTAKPTTVPTSAPTRTPTAKPTSTQSSNPTPVPTQIPVGGADISQSPTTVPAVSPTPVASEGRGFGKYLALGNAEQPSPAPTEKPQAQEQKPAQTQTLIAGIVYWSEILAGIGFVLLILSILTGFIRHFYKRK